MAGQLFNIFSIKDGEIIQLDDMLASKPTPVPPVPPGPTPPGPTPPGPTPPGPTPPGPQVDVTISVTGDIITIIAVGDVSYIDGYNINVYSGSTKVFTYKDEDDADVFDMGTLYSDIPIGNYTVKVQAYNDDGTVFAESNGASWTRNPDSRIIWVKIKFQDKTYNPQEHQLAVGKASTRTDDYGTNDRKKAYSADWQCIDPSANIWMWGVTSGTNVDKAFSYGSYDDVGSSLFMDEDFDQTMPADLMIEEGSNIYTDAASWRASGLGLPSNIEYTGKVEILAWDLYEATALNGFIGTNLWYDIPVYGTLPAITTKASEITYAFDRLFHVTAMGDITFVGNSTPSIINAFYTMTSLTSLPNIIANKSVNSSNAFRGSCNASKESIESVYSTLLGYVETYGNQNHDGTFKHCGIKVDPNALRDIPTSWGGDATIVGTNVDGNISPLAVGGKILRF